MNTKTISIYAVLYFSLGLLAPATYACCNFPLPPSPDFESAAFGSSYFMANSAGLGQTGVLVGLVGQSSAGLGGDPAKLATLYEQQKAPTLDVLLTSGTDTNAQLSGLLGLAGKLAGPSAAPQLYAPAPQIYTPIVDSWQSNNYSTSSGSASSVASVDPVQMFMLILFADWWDKTHQPPKPVVPKNIDNFAGKYALDLIGGIDEQSTSPIMSWDARGFVDRVIAIDELSPSAGKLLALNDLKQTIRESSEEASVKQGDAFAYVLNKIAGNLELARLLDGYLIALGKVRQQELGSGYYQLKSDIEGFKNTFNLTDMELTKRFEKRLQFIDLNGSSGSKLNQYWATHTTETEALLKDYYNPIVEQINQLFIASISEELIKILKTMADGAISSSDYLLVDKAANDLLNKFPKFKKYNLISEKYANLLQGKFEDADLATAAEEVKTERKAMDKDIAELEKDYITDRQAILDSSNYKPIIEKFLEQLNDLYVQSGLEKTQNDAVYSIRGYFYDVGSHYTAWINAKAKTKQAKINYDNMKIACASNPFNMVCWVGSYSLNSYKNEYQYAEQQENNALNSYQNFVSQALLDKLDTAARTLAYSERQYALFNQTPEVVTLKENLTDDLMDAFAPIKDELLALQKAYNGNVSNLESTNKFKQAITQFNALLKTKDASAAKLIAQKEISEAQDQSLNVAPKLTSGGNKTAWVGTKVTLSISAVDPDNWPNPLTYIWKQTEGPNTALSNTKIKTPSFTPSKPGIYRFSVQAFDGKSKSQKVVISVSVNAMTILPQP